MPLTVVNAVTFSLPNLPISAVRFSVKCYPLEVGLLPQEGGILDIFLGEEVRPGPSYPDPV